MNARVSRPCLHPRAAHQHGTHLAYRFDGCRCTPCETAGRRNHKATAYRTLTGTHSYVSADPARAHVLELLQVLTVGQVEQRSGVHRTAIRVLIGDFPGRAASRRITRKTESALLAVTAERVGPETQGLVDGAGTRRRIRALVALGHPAAHLCARLGMSPRTIWQLTDPDVDESAPVRTSTRDVVRRLYDELSLTLPPPGRAATRARRLAAARGWAAPLAWDDDSIDDPATQPALGEDEDCVDELAVEAVLDGHHMSLTGATLLAALARFDEASYPIAIISARLRIPEYQVFRLRGRDTVTPRYRGRAAAAGAVAA